MTATRIQPSAQGDQKKTCTTCRHAVPNEHLGLWCVKLTVFELMLGHIPGLCSDLRNVGARCGPDGLWWEERSSGRKKLCDLIASFRYWF